MGKVEFRTFGSAELRQPDGTAVLSVLAQPKRVALLSYLAAHGVGSFVRRDALCGAFWPDADQSQARHRLRTALHMLRKALGHGTLIGRGDEEVGLSETAFWFDVESFERAVEEGRHEEALELYRGDFLAGFHVDASHEFEEWLRGTRERLQALAASSARALAASAAALGEREAAVRWAARAREIAPLDEGALRDHMEALDRAGRRAEALREHEAWARRLEAELGTEPAPETTELAERIRSRDEPRPAPGLPAPEGEAAGGGPRGDASPAAPIREGALEAEPTRPSAGRAAALTAAVALGGAAFFAARVAGAGGDAAQPAGVSLLAYLVSWLIIVVGLWFLFERAEETASSAGRARVAAWLRPTRARSGTDGAEWAEGFAGAFDRIFGPRHLSLHCFLRSTAASVVAVTVLLLLWVAIRPEQFTAFASSQGPRGLGELLLITFLVNVVADYLSLLETRVALGFLGRWRSAPARAGVLVADALATLVVWLVFYAGLPFLVLAGMSSTANDIMLFLQFQVWSYAPTIGEVMSLSAEGGGPPVGIWFYSTFLTSIWLWLYLAAGGLARTADAAGRATARGLRGLSGWFDAERQPFRVLGLAAMLIVTAAYGFGWILNAL